MEAGGEAGGLARCFVREMVSVVCGPGGPGGERYYGSKSQPEQESIFQLALAVLQHYTHYLEISRKYTN